MHFLNLKKNTRALVLCFYSANSFVSGASGPKIDPPPKEATTLTSVEDVRVIAILLEKAIRDATKRLYPQVTILYTSHCNYEKLVTINEFTRETKPTELLVGILKNKEAHAVFLMDINVPIGAQGDEAAACIRKTEHDICTEDATLGTKARLFSYLVAVTAHDELLNGTHEARRFFNEVMGKITKAQEIIDILSRSSLQIAELLIAIQKTPFERTEIEVEMVRVKLEEGFSLEKPPEPDSPAKNTRSPKARD